MKLVEMLGDMAASRQLLLGRWTVRRAHEAEEKVSIEVDDLRCSPVAPGDERVTPSRRTVDDDSTLGKTPTLRPAALNSLRSSCGGLHGGHLPIGPGRRRGISPVS